MLSAYPSDEMVHIKGYPPFCSENAHDVYRKIIDWRNHLFFPDDVHLSREAEDLVRR
jgi:protein-serine/threonine kinase